jgi:hypothetical protein
MPNYGTVLNTLRGLFTAPVADGTQSQWRGDGFNNGIVVPSGMPMQQLVQDGRVWTAMNATPGTGLVHAVVTAFSATAGLFTHYNPGPNYVFPWSLKMLTTNTATATAQPQYFLFILDKGPRAPTANNVALTINNQNPASSRTTQSVINWATAGSLTLPAAVGPTTVAKAIITTGVMVAGDSFSFQFGGYDNSPKNGGAAARATDPALLPYVTEPFAIPPGYYLAGYRWGPNEATNAMAFDLSYCFIE